MVILSGSSEVLNQHQVGSIADQPAIENCLAIWRDREIADLEARRGKWDLQSCDLAIFACHWVQKADGHVRFDIAVGLTRS